MMGGTFLPVSLGMGGGQGDCVWVVWTFEIGRRVWGVARHRAGKVGWGRLGKVLLAFFYFIVENNTLPGR